MNSTKALGIMILCLLTGLGAISARADQITLGASSQSVTLTGTGATNSLSAELGSCSAGMCTLSGFGFTPDGELGTYKFVTTVGTANPLFGPNNGLGVFAIFNTNGTSTVFTYTDPDGDSSVSTPITYVLLGNGTADPHLDFSTPAGDFILSGSSLTCSGIGVSACNIDNVALVSGAKASGSISSGQVLASVSAPEPATNGLLGAGLVSLFALASWRKKIRTIS